VLPGLAQRWIARYARRRQRKELDQYLNPPKVRLAGFRRRSGRSGSQVFRSLVQVNLYPDGGR
jgi:hypothetical protein